MRNEEWGMRNEEWGMKSSYRLPVFQASKKIWIYLNKLLHFSTPLRLCVKKKGDIQSQSWTSPPTPLHEWKRGDNSLLRLHSFFSKISFRNLPPYRLTCSKKIWINWACYFIYINPTINLRISAKIRGRKMGVTQTHFISITCNPSQ